MNSNAIKWSFLLGLLIFSISKEGLCQLASNYYVPDENIDHLFYDDFLTNKNNWKIVIDEHSFREIENGVIKSWSFFTNDSRYWRSAFSLKKIDIDESKNFEIEASIRCIQYGVSPVSLIWGRNSETLKTFYFGFNSDGSVQILKYENDQFHVFYNKKCNFFNPNSFNRLTVRKSYGWLYFFINSNLIFKMPYLNLPGHEIGFQSPSNTTIEVDFIRISYLGSTNYEKKLKNLVTAKLNKWQLQGKFEKTMDFRQRVNAETKGRFLAKTTQDVIDSMATEKAKISIVGNKYDPDSEKYKLYLTSNDSIEIHVPIKEARIFDENIGKLDLKPRFTLENNTFPLVYMDITNLQNKRTYSYRTNKEPYDLRRIFPEIGEVDTVIIPKKIILQEIAVQETNLKMQLAEITNQLKVENKLSENVKTSVDAKVVEVKNANGKNTLDYQITYSYDVIKALFENQTDDFKAGEYRTSGSNAAKLTLEVLKKTIDHELINYLKNGTKVTVKITGSADATPINNSIKYNGEFGNFRDENFFYNNHLSTININQNEGIKTNEQLAFLRTYSVRQFMETYIDGLQNTQNVFQHYCTVSKEVGSQYRRIAIELTIHNAFKGKQASDIFAKTESVSDVDKDIPSTGTKNDKTFALVIGNENYLNEIKVPYALNDAKIFREYCTNTFGIPENQVHYIENATFGQMQGEIQWLIDVIRAFNGEAKIFFYYAGHGVPDETNHDPYILPIDGNSVVSATSIKLDDLYNKLQLAKTKSVTVFLDACFTGTARSGSLMADSRGVAIKPKMNVLRNNLVVFSATSNNETALPYKEENHGIFTYFLLKRIKETNGNVSYGDLYDYIKTNVYKQSIVINRKAQTPSVNTSFDIADLWKSFTLKN